MTLGEFSLSIVFSSSYPARFTRNLFEEAMKWAYEDYTNLCLPEAVTQGNRIESFLFFTKVNFFPRWGQKSIGVSLLSDRDLP